MTRQVWRTAIIGALAALPVAAHGHPGGLDAAGCHHDRKHGGYHCHGGGRASRPAASVARLFGSGDGGGGGSFPNCAAARAAGAAPVRIGRPGYAPRLDRDGDGIGCE